MKRHAPTRSKYGARKTVVDGITFDSAAEARRYAELRLLERAGEIRNLELQPTYPLLVNGKKVGAYKADFRFFSGNETVVEDVKGFRTPVYRLKKKLVEALYHVRIREVQA